MAWAGCVLGSLSASYERGTASRREDFGHHSMVACRSNIGHATIRMVSNFHLDPPFGGSFQAPTPKGQHPGDTEVSHRSSPIFHPKGGFWCRQVASGEDFGGLRWSPVQPCGSRPTCLWNSASKCRIPNRKCQISNSRFRIPNASSRILNVRLGLG